MRERESDGETVWERVRVRKCERVREWECETKRV